MAFAKELNETVAEKDLKIQSLQNEIESLKNEMKELEGNFEDMN